MTERTQTRMRPRMLLATTALGAALAGLGAAPVLAATDQEAENLRRDIESFLADPGYPGWSFSNGPVTAEVVDEGYNFVIPDLVITYDQPPSEVTYGDPGHAVITLDDLNLRMTPDPVDPDLFSLQAQFGGGSLFGGGAVQFTIEGDGGERALIDIASHKVSGTWSDEIAYFTEADLSFQDIVIVPDPTSPDAPNVRVSIGSITGTSTMTEVEPGIWDGSGDSAFENIVVEEDGDVPFRLGRLAITQTVGGFAFQDYLRWIEANPVMMGEEPEFATEEEASAFFRETMLGFPTIMDDFSIGWTLTDLDAGESGEHVLIPNHEFLLSATGLAGDLSAWSLRLFAEGMTIPEGEVPPQFVPTIIDINVDIADLPTGLGWQAMEDTVSTTDLRDLEDMGPMLGQQIIQLALQSQTGMDLDGQIAWETGNIEFTGSVHADPTSPMMASGGLSVVFNQMQEFIQEVESTMGAETAGPLTMIQAMGQQEEGRTVYDFQISGSNILMNGQDMQPLMMMLGQ